jgi:DNA-directed RNA polymerase subunit RPC12/RpoP
VTDEHAADQPAAVQAPSYFHCAECGAKLSYAPGTESLVCDHCGHENIIEHETETIHELDFRAYLGQLASGAETTEVTTVRCDSCGVQIDRPPGLDAFACPYCGSNIVATGTTDRIIRPRALLPFRIVEHAAFEAFGAWIRSRWFAPSDLKRYARTDHRLSGVYVPYWTYDCRTTANYIGQRGEYYWTTETYTTMENGRHVTRTRRVRRVRWYPASGTVNNAFDDILVLASRSLPKVYADKLEPWDLQSLTPYRDEYLAGFRAEKYQVPLDRGFEEAQQRMEPVIRATVCRDIGGDVQRITSLRVKHDDITFKHVLLPIWISAYRFRERVFRILVNARTGEVQGERPWSFWKIFFAVAAALLVVAVIVLIANR